MKLTTLILFVFLTGYFRAQNDTLTIVSYNLLNFPDGRNDCGSGNVNLPNRTDSLRKIMQYLKPDVLVACEIQTEAGADSVLTRSLNVFGASNYEMAPFQYSNGGGGTLNNAMYYNADKLVFLRQKAVLTSSRDINHYTLMVIDPNIALHRDTVFVEVHMAHLKAGSSAADQAERAGQTQIFRSYLESKPLQRNHLFCGDFNVYKSSEAAYQNLISGGDNPLFDPIFTPGNWNNNASFAHVHTQSPRSSGSWACGATGGMDDRFDQILVTQNVLSGSDRLSYIANSYIAVGNDGQHYNTSLLGPPINAIYPDSVVRAIYYLSDHLPVSMKVVVDLPTDNGLGLTLVKNGPLCAGDDNGLATVAPLYGQAPYTFQWDANANNQTTASASNLSPGSYCVEVTDATGLSDVVCFEIESIPGLSVSIFPTSSSALCDGQAAALVSGGTPPYAFSWNDPLAQTTQSAVNLCPGTYICSISDQGGCEKEVTVVVEAQANLLEKALRSGQILVAPNPFSDFISIRNLTDEAIPLSAMRLVDAKGVIVREISACVLEIDSQLQIDLSEVGMGFYVLELTNDRGVYYVKMMK